MKFNDLPYARPNIDEVLKNTDCLIGKLADATHPDEVIAVMNEADELFKNFETAFALSYVRHSINTKDEFYDSENTFFNEQYPIVSAKQVEYARALFNHPYKTEVARKVGQHLFDLLECSLVLNEKAIPFMQKENELSSKYDKIIANAQIEFEGKIYTLTQMSPLLQNTDRAQRKAAYDAMWAWIETHEEDFDTIYDELVKTRCEMAKALGYDSYIDLRYKLMSRTCYNQDHVAEYREKIQKYITPVAVKLREKQAELLELDDLKFYDRALDFKDGNSDPKGDVDTIVSNAQKMYRELSPETGEFFDFMVENELMDLVAKPGKEGGGYCITFDSLMSPFIFSNFNGTRGDIEVITHEAGHAFQAFQGLKMPYKEYIWPTNETAEIHSMSMEFLTWPWMDLFFGENTNKFKYSHLKGAISFLPYGATIDEFQHFVYENPQATPSERKQKYREIELKYQPDLNYDNDFLNKGTFWYKQGHVFASPFYYIDYTLAQVCAFQYLLKSLENKELATQEYITLCKAAGSDNFFNLVKVGNLENPMISDVLERIAPQLLDILENIEL